MSEPKNTLAPSAQQQQSVVYRPIPGFPGYEVGSDGTVRSYRQRGRNALSVTARIRRPEIINGYWSVPLRNDGRQFQKRVHRLVLEAFVGPCPAGMEGCHNDGNPHNNHISNLRWDTKKSNMADQVQHGTRTRGEMRHNAKLTESQVAEIRARYLTEPARVLAVEFGVQKRTIECVARGQSWAHSPGAVTKTKNRKINAEDAERIRARRQSGESLKAIGRDYGLCVSAVSIIASGKRWKKTG